MMQRTIPLNLEAALEQVTPTRAQWNAWARREPSLAGLTYGDLRRALRTARQDRKDQLLGALVRATHADLGAFAVLAACLLPGIRYRIARLAPLLERQDALAIMVEALYEAVAAYHTTEQSRFVAGALLELPTRRLRHAAATQRSWSAHACHAADANPPASGVELSATAMLASAVDAGVVSDRDAQLILATRVAGRSLREEARHLGLGYDAAKKRRQRAEARWAAWWTSGAARVPGRRNRDHREGKEAA
jgi:hypothetical protein